MVRSLYFHHILWAYRQTLSIVPEILGNPTATLLEVEQKMEVCPLSFSCIRVSHNSRYKDWARTLPEHLRFSEQSLQVQQSMFETSSNTGAWCWCYMHVYYASCALALNFVNIAFLLAHSFLMLSSVSIGPTACAARTKTRYTSST